MRVTNSWKLESPSPTAHGHVVLNVGPCEYCYERLAWMCLFAERERVKEYCSPSINSKHMYLKKPIIVLASTSFELALLLYS